MLTALLLQQHIQILMKNINYSTSYGDFCMCMKHFASHYKGDAKSKRSKISGDFSLGREHVFWTCLD